MPRSSEPTERPAELWFIAEEEGSEGSQSKPNPGTVAWLLQEAA